MGNVQLYIQSRGEGGRGDCARVLCATEKISFLGEKGNSSRHRRDKKEPKEKTRCLKNISMFTLFCRTTHNTKTHTLPRFPFVASFPHSLSLSSPEEKKGGKRMYVLLEQGALNLPTSLLSHTHRSPPHPLLLLLTPPPPGEGADCPPRFPGQSLPALRPALHGAE